MIHLIAINDVNYKHCANLINQFFYLTTTQFLFNLFHTDFLHTSTLYICLCQLHSPLVQCQAFVVRSFLYSCDTQPLLVGVTTLPVFLNTNYTRSAIIQCGLVSFQHQFYQLGTGGQTQRHSLLRVCIHSQGQLQKHRLQWPSQGNP